MVVSNLHIISSENKPKLSKCKRSFFFSRQNKTYFFGLNIMSILICQTMICSIFIFLFGKLSLKVYMVTLNHVIDGTVQIF